MTTLRAGVDSSTPVYLPDEVLSVRPTASATPAGGGGHRDDGSGGGGGGGGGGGWTLAGWHVPADTPVTAGQRLATLSHSATGAVAYVTAPAAGTLVGPFGPPGGALVPGSPLPRNVDARTVVGRLLPCAHAVAFEGLCALGGWGGGGGDGGGGAWGDAVRGRDGSGGGGSDRSATAEARSSKQRLAVAYEAGGGLSVTVDEAAALDAGTARRLLSERRLSLVLDLDHTLVHATDDPRAAADVAAVIRGASPGGPDEEPDDGRGVDAVAAAGIHALCLVDATGHPGRPMHVKLRPGLSAFLAAARVAFELHIYTMGTRRYAAAVASLLDGGDGSLFRGRVTSREDFGEGALNRKNLRRVFPCDDSMVLIVDDRDDVWLAPPQSPGSGGGGGPEPMRNLVKARPYMFWNGFADVYSRDEPAGGTAGKGGVGGGAGGPAGGAAGDTAAYAPSISALRPSSAAISGSVPAANDPKSASSGADDAAAMAGTNGKAETTSGTGDMKVAANGEAKTSSGSDDMKVDANGVAQTSSVLEGTEVVAHGEAKTSSGTDDGKVAANGEVRAAPGNEDRMVINGGANGGAPEATAAQLPPNSSAERERVLAAWSRADDEDGDHLGKLLAVLMEAHRRFFAAADAAMPPLPARSRPSSPAGMPSPSSPSESPPGVLRPGAAAPAPRAFKRPRRAPSPGLGRSIGGATLPPPAVKPTAALVPLPHPLSLGRPGSPGGVPGIPWRVPADVKDVLDALRRETLRGVRLTMTGVYPSPLPSEGASRGGGGGRSAKPMSHAPLRERASAVERARHAAALATLARTQPLAAAAVRAGATVDATFSATATTHVVANPIRGRETDKSRRARALGGVFIVTTAWLRASLDNWERAPELPYALYPPPPGAPGGGPAATAAGTGKGGAATAVAAAPSGGDKPDSAGRRSTPSTAASADYAAAIRAVRASRLADTAAREAAAAGLRDGRAPGGSPGGYRSTADHGGGDGGGRSSGGVCSGGRRYGVPAGRDGTPGGGGSKRTYSVARGGGGPLSMAGRVPVTAAKPPTPDRRPPGGAGGGGVSDLDDFAARLESELLADQSSGK
ncbi:hypothetical protein MMPV_000353 [Pyropia vietnamensis]